MKKLINILSEILLIIIVFIYWFYSSLILNPIAIFLILLLVFTLLLRNKILTIITSTIIGLLSLLMIFAVISEFNEFELGDKEGIRLLVIGLALFITTIILTVIMGFKSLVAK